MRMLGGSVSFATGDCAYPPQGFGLIIAVSMNFKILGESSHLSG
jgi:hypothetical protein